MVLAPGAAEVVGADRLEATARIDRDGFGVSWQDELPGGGVVASNEIDLTLDAEAINLDDLERTGPIEFYRATERPRPRRAALDGAATPQ